MDERTTPTGTNDATFDWRPFENGHSFGFAVAHDQPLVAHVWHSFDGDGVGWDVTTGHGTIGGDADSVNEGQSWCELASADWSREQDQRRSDGQADMDRWVSDNAVDGW